MDSLPRLPYETHGGEYPAEPPKRYLTTSPTSAAKTIGEFLRHTLTLIQRSLWLLLAIIGVFLVLAVVVTMLQTPKYTAEATIEIQNRTQEVLGDNLDTTSADQPDSWDIDRFLNTQLDILRSRAVAQRVAQRLSLYADPRFFTAMRAAPEEFNSQQERRNAVLDLLGEHFSADLPIDTRVAQLEFTSTDPQLSADVVNAFATEFIQASLQRRFDSSSYARSFVSDQLQEARARLESSERELNAYARSAGLIRTRDASADGGSNISSSVTAASLMQVNEAANRAEAAKVAAEARWQTERAQPLLSSPAALESSTVQALMARKTEIEGDLQSARERYLGDYPTVVRLKAELDTANNQLLAAAKEARNSVHADYLAAASAADRLRTQVDELQGATLAEQDRSVRYNTLAREADTNRSVYEGLLQRFRELNASAGITASNIAVLDRGEPPIEPSSPNLLLNLAVGLILGAGVAALILLIRDQLDDRIRVPEDVENKVGLTLLGVIPQAPDPQAALADPQAPMSEAYSALQSALRYSTRDGLPKVMLVTSSQSMEGKSTTSYAIARGVARAGKRALLVDGDLRRPSIHRLFGVKNTRGLSTILVGEDRLEDVLVHAPDPNLQVVTSGPIPPNPAELLSSPRMTSLLNELRHVYDFVIIDSPPVLGLSDASELSALSDGVLLVIEADRGQGGQLKAAVRRLRAIHPVLLGAVLTKFDPEKAGNQYSTYYGHEYYRYRTDETGEFV